MPVSPISENLAGSLRQNREKLAKVPSTRKIWFNGDRPLEMGERVVQADFAAALREIATTGSAAFYRGTIAQKTAAYMKNAGGILDAKDLSAYGAVEDTPIHINYKGIEVYECPPNSQGHVMLQAMNTLEGMNVHDCGEGVRRRVQPAWPGPGDHAGLHCRQGSRGRDSS